MIRVLLFFLIVVAIAIGWVWLADRPGDIVITWLGYRLETSVIVGAAALALLIAFTILFWSILRGIVRAPSAISSAFSNRRSNRAYRAVSRGIVAIGAGDRQAARRFANEARRLMPQEPLALLLSAQTAQLAGDNADAEKTFRKMADRKDTKLLGLHGLYVEAQRRDDPAAARACAEDAAKAQPGLAWAAEAVLQYRCADGDWVGALAALERNMQNGLLEKPVYKRQRAVLLTARALASQSDRETATGLALHALKLSPGLVPAAALAGRLLAEAGRARKATRVVSAAWQINPHPDLAAAYAAIKPHPSALDRLTRIRALMRLTPNHPESILALARAALDANEFDLVRETLRPLLANPTQRVAALMAELEEKASGDIGRSREWMARAITASRDPAWTADGLVSDTWLPASPVTGRIDAFEWRIPVMEVGTRGPLIDYIRTESPASATTPPAPPAAPASPPVSGAATAAAGESAIVIDAATSSTASAPEQADMAAAPTSVGADTEPPPPAPPSESPPEVRTIDPTSDIAPAAAAPLPEAAPSAETTGTRMDGGGTGTDHSGSAAHVATDSRLTDGPDRSNADNARR